LNRFAAPFRAANIDLSGTLPEALANIAAAHNILA